jgi:hypothetical protein
MKLEAESIRERLKIRHPRPKRFSNPTREYEPEALQKILQKPGGLSVEDLFVIFDPSDVVGRYEEVVYFLPEALASIDEGLKSRVLQWISGWWSNLSGEGLADWVSDFLLQLLERKTAEFVLETDFSPVVDTFKPLYVKSPVRDGGIVSDILAEFLRNESIRNLGKLFVERIVERGRNDDCAASWVVVLAAHFVNRARSSRRAHSDITKSMIFKELFVEEVLRALLEAAMAHGEEFLFRVVETNPPRVEVLECYLRILNEESGLLSAFWSGELGALRNKKWFVPRAGLEFRL